MTTIVDSLNSILWGYVLVYGLLGVGVFFTIRLGFLQFLNFGEMIRAIRGSRDSDVHGISPRSEEHTSELQSPA